MLINPKLTTATAVIEALGSLLIDGGFGKPTLTEAALDREMNYPTGLLLGAAGANAAIPHAENVHVKSPAVAVAVLEEPVAFHQMDDPDSEIPVRLVFLLALPNAESQLQALRALGRALQDQELIARLLDCKTAEALITTIAKGGVGA